MHNAPSVMFPVGRCGLYGVVLLLLAALGAGALGLWWSIGATPRTSWLGLAGCVLWVVWAAFALWTWRRSPVGQLRWNALEKLDLVAPPCTWHWHGESCSEGAPLQRVDLMMDWQDIALLRLHHANAFARWIWVERARNPALWNDLRRALVSARA